MICRSLFYSSCCMLVVFLSISQRVRSQESYYCANTTTYDPNGNSAYRANLNLLFTTLSNASRTFHFYNFTTGLNNSNTIYGLFMCRGDVTSDACEQCVANAGTRVLELCPDRKVATIWFEFCLLRYSNQSIFSIPNRSVLATAFRPENVTNAQLSRFNELLGNVMDELAILAANHDSGDKFAVQERNFSEDQKLFALAQCTPDLSRQDCDICLRDAISFIPRCCDRRQGGRVLFPSCNIRFEPYKFYNIIADAPPSVPLPNVTPTITSSKDGNDISTAQSLMYNLSQIEAATNNFSVDHKIGEGGFGDVYKGTLPNGQEIAVKRLSRTSVQGVEEFKNEIVLVAKLQHKNLARLLGFSYQAQEKMLVYEFVPNKSLDNFLFDPEKQPILDWSRRQKIIEGIARGLLYLHEDAPVRIIHRDLKASNVLLNAKMEPKIADFGTARMFLIDQSKEETSRIAGTYGYMSPEYAMRGQFSVKSDVYSFGVLVLEIISGKKNSSFYQSEGSGDLLSYAWKSWRDGTPLALLDPSLGDSYARNEVIQCIHVGLLCVQEDVEERPTMASVVLMLNSYSVILPAPQRPGFFVRTKTQSWPVVELESDRSTDKSMPVSVDDKSITEVYPR